MGRRHETLVEEQLHLIIDPLNQLQPTESGAITYSRVLSARPVNYQPAPIESAIEDIRPNSTIWLAWASSICDH